MENSSDFEVIEDARQSSDYAKYIQSIGWKVIQINKIYIFLKNIFGLKIAKIQRTKVEMPWKKIFEILKKEKVFSLRYEPTDGNKPVGFGYSSWPLIGTKTLRINLRPSETTIINSFKKDCRYTLRQGFKRNIQFSIDKFDEFYEIWKKEARRKRLWIPSNKEYIDLVNCFGEKVFCVTYKDIAGAVILMHKKTAFYYYSACLPEGKPLQLPYLIVWEAMKVAKKKGCNIWDFEGIYDERWPNIGWKGFSHFKKSFGGKEVPFPGSFQKWLWPW